MNAQEPTLPTEAGKGLPPRSWALPELSCLLARYGRALALLACLAAAAIGLDRGDLPTRLVAPSPYTMLPSTFAVWDREPISRHLMLVFDLPGDFEKGSAYQNLPPSWLALLYLCVKPLELLGIPYVIGQNVIVLLTFGAVLLLIFASLEFSAWARADGFAAERMVVFGLLLLAVGIVATLPSLWVASVIGNPEDHNRFIATITFVYLSVLDFKNRLLDRLGWIAAVIVALIAPMYAPFLILALWILGRPGGGPERRGLTWPCWKSQTLILTTITVLGLVLPYLLLFLGGFRGIGSSFLFRSGLDGSTRYFTSMLQAVLSPFDTNGRAWELLPLPLAALVAAGVMFVYSRPLAERMLRQLLVGFTPTLFWIVLFPQAVSIHPYYFDFGLMFPSAFCLAFWLTDAQIQSVLVRRRGLLLALVILLIGLLMTSGLDLARASRLPLR
jgi:hypothetical protein